MSICSVQLFLFVPISATIISKTSLTLGDFPFSALRPYNSGADDLVKGSMVPM